jgi:hypothetical protein
MQNPSVEGRQDDGSEFTAVVLRAIRDLNATLISGRRHLGKHAFCPDESVREPVVEEPDEVSDPPR